MNKLLAFFLLGFLSLNLLGQRVNKIALKIENDKVFQNNTLFNGQMYELYQSGFLKSLSNVKNGVLDGEVRLFTDNNKSYSSYQDSTILKSYEDSLKVYSKMLYEFQKDSAKYDREVSTIFNEEIKTKENLNEWIEKYESGKLNKKKTAIYEELKTASYNLDRARVDLKIIREKNLNCQIRRKKEREKPVYQNVLTDRYQYSNGVKSGKHEIYFKDGKIIQEEYYTNDLLNGDFKKFDSYGKLIESGTFVNGKKEDEWKTYDSYGKLTKLETYLDNKKNGKFQEFQNEKLLTEGQHKDNLKDGEWKTYDYRGKLSVLENYKSDKHEGFFKKYSGDIITEEGQYVGGLMNGEWKTYSINGKLTSISNYLNGKLNGISREYSSSTTDVIFEYNFQDNNLAGTQTGYYPDKSIAFKVIDDFSKLNKLKKALELIYLGEEIKSYRIDSTAECYLNAYEITYLNNFDLKSKLLGDKLYDIYVKEDKYSALIVQLYDIYLKNHKDPIIQKKRDDVETERQKVLNEWYAEMEALTENMREDIERFKSKNQESNSSDEGNNSKNIVWVKGYIKDRYYATENNYLTLKISFKCGHCGSNVMSGGQWVVFKNRPDDCEEKIYECLHCNKKSLLKPCLIKSLNKEDTF
jgi:antitoxin component YwqK of YwqJK toxin-antitoxin module